MGWATPDQAVAEPADSQNVFYLIFFSRPSKDGSMQLHTGDSALLKAPSADQVANALTRLNDGKDSFVILQKDEQVYVQTAGSATKGFHLEYREGSEDLHFQATTSVPLEVVVEVFQRFLSNDPNWRTQVAWEPWLTAEPRTSSRLPPGVWAAVIVVGALAAVVWFAAT